MTTLRDLGERRIIREILPQFVSDVGSDCAIVDVRSRQLVMTTDPVPEPAARVIAGDADPYWMGWLLVVINASDLAASGAIPVAFLAAVEAPSDLDLNDFKRFLSGIADCCAAEQLKYVGGNLREGPRLTAVGTAFGESGGVPPIGRRGALPGDVLVSVGRGGVFWRDAMSVLSGVTVDKETSPLFRPHSQSRGMRLLSERGWVNVAMDNSDGLLPTLEELSRINDVGIELNLSELRVESRGGDLTADPARLWLGWGDWNVVAAISPQHFTKAVAVMESSAVSITRLGSFVEGPAEVRLRRGNRVSAAPRLESERFAADSWFGTGIQGYIDRLLSVPLP